MATYALKQVSNSYRSLRVNRPQGIGREGQGKMSLGTLHYSYFEFLDQWNWDMMGTLTFDNNMP